MVVITFMVFITFMGDTGGITGHPPTVVCAKAICPCAMTYMVQSITE